MQKHSFLVGGILLLIPATLLTGCGGGGGSSTIAVPTATPATPVPTTSPTARPTTVPTTSPTARPTTAPITVLFSDVAIPLGDGRTAKFSLSRQGNRAFGTFVIPDRLPSTPFLSLDPGTYALTGTFTEPRSIDVNGLLRARGVTIPLSFAGTFPTATQAGVVQFTLTAPGSAPTVVSITLPPTR